MKLLRVLIVASVCSSLAVAGEPTTAELQSRAREFEKYDGKVAERDAAARQEHAQRIEEYNRQLEAIKQQAEEARQKQERKEALTADETAALEREKLLNDLAAQEAFVILDFNFQDVRSQSGLSSEQLAQAQAARDDAAQALQSRNAGSAYTKAINDAAQALEEQRIAVTQVPKGTDTTGEAQKVMAPIEDAITKAKAVIDGLKNNPKSVTPAQQQSATTGVVDATAKAVNSSTNVASSAVQSLQDPATQKDATQTKSAVQVLKEYANKARTYVIDAWNTAADGLASTQERLDKFVTEIKTANDKAEYVKSKLNSVYYAKRAIGEESAYIAQVQKSLSEFDTVLSANQKLAEFSVGLRNDNYWTQTVKVQDLFDRVTSSLTSAQASLAKMEKVELDLSTARADNRAKRDRLDALNQRYFDPADPNNKQYKTLQDKLQADYSALLGKGRDKLLYRDLFTPTVIAALRQDDIPSEQRITSSDAVAQLQQKITDNPILLDRLQEAWEKQNNIDTDLVLQKIKILRDVTARYTYDQYLAGTVNDLAFDNTSGATMIDQKYGTWPKTYQAWKDQFNLYDAQLDISQNIFDSYQEQYKQIRQQLQEEISYLKNLIKDPSLLRYSPPVDDVLVDQIKNFTGYPDKPVADPADTQTQRQAKLQAALDWQQVKSYGYKKESDGLRDLNSAFGTRTLTPEEQALVAARNQRREYLAQAKAQSDFLIADLTWQMKKEFGPAQELAAAEATRLLAAEALQEKGIGSAYTKSIVDKIPLPTKQPVTAAALAGAAQPVETQKNALSKTVTQAPDKKQDPEKNTIVPLRTKAKDIAGTLDALQLALTKQREELEAAEAPEKEEEDAVEKQNEIGQSLMKLLIILLLELLKQLTDDKDHIFYMGQRFFAGVAGEDEESGDFATTFQDKLREHYESVFGHEEDADQKIYELLFDKVIIPLIDQNKLDPADRISPNDSRAELQRKVQKHPELAQAARQAWQDKLVKEEGSDDAANKKAQELGIEQAADILGNDTARYTYDSYLAGNADRLAFDNNNKEMVVDKQTWQDQYSTITETFDQLNNKASILLEEVTSQLERMKNLVPKPS